VEHSFSRNKFRSLNDLLAVFDVMDKSSII
jgi:hypothetical protein